MKLGPLMGAVALAGSLAAGAADTEEKTPAVLALGASAPMADVKMKNVDGKDFSITDVAGKKGTLVVFTCNACPWAQAWEKRIVAIGNTYPAKGIGVIAINPNDPSKVGEDDYPTMQRRAKQGGMKFPYVVDATSDLARAHGATRTPEAYLFDADGKLVYHGTIDDNAREPEKVSRRYLEEAMKALLEGREIAVAQTKALGCTIKFRPEV
jgi:peroxiredoxin